MSLTMYSYTILSMFTNNVNFYQVKMLILYNVETTNLTFVDKIKLYIYIVSDNI